MALFPQLFSSVQLSDLKISPARLVRTALLTGACVTLLSGCSWLADWPPAGDENRRSEAPPPPPPSAKVMRAADGTWLVPSSDVQARDIRPIETQGARGLQVNTDLAARLEALEREVEVMRNDMALMMPALTKLAAAQGEVQSLLAQISNNVATDFQNINTAAGDTGNPAPLQPHLQSAEPPVTKAAPSYDRKITNLRMGEHPDKTRLVLDASDKVAFSYDIDNNSRILKIKFENAGWDGAPAMRVENSPIVASYSTAPDEQGGTTMAFDLKQAAQIVWSQYLPPTDGSGPRIVVDIAPL